MLYTDSKYTKWHNTIIERAETRITLDGYYETHHILPKALGGTDDPTNLVKLTAKEHYIVHLLLMKMCVEPVHRQKMCAAWLYMATVRNDHTTQHYTSRLYEYHKIIRAKILSEQMSGEGNPNYGKTHSEETRRRISEARKGVDTNTPEGLERKRQRFLDNNPMDDPEIAKKAAYNHSKTYSVTFPDGHTENVHNMAQFCRKHNLHPGNMCSVAKGKLMQYKGFVCSYV